jgi:class 3 adenylate cyclase
VPIYLDRHDLRGHTAADVADAHRRDLEVQGRYGVKFLAYWFDEARGSNFCLIDAPDARTANRVHDEAHGEVAIDIIEVDISAVEAFLGRISDPAPKSRGTARPIDPGFRAVMFTDIVDSTGMTTRLGDARATELVRAHDSIVRRGLADTAGREVKHTGDGIMASFSTTSNGVEAAIMMQRGVVAHNTANPNLPLHLKIGINAGEPISEDNDLFGTTVQMAARIVDKAQADQIFVSEIVRGICAGKPIRFTNRGAYEMKGFDGGVVLYEALWQETQQAAEAPAAAAQS